MLSQRVSGYGCGRAHRNVNADQPRNPVGESYTPSRISFLLQIETVNNPEDADTDHFLLN
jgi:hypothetical protein